LRSTRQPWKISGLAHFAIHATTWKISGLARFGQLT
jgi:hypothetical protein